MDIRIALAGNPNSGKTTLFNALTGSNQFVGNWPGVTVEKKEGKLKKHSDVTVTDLPGIYSLSPYTMEEVVARNYLIEERPDAILNIIDGTNLERNLYLTTQLTELGIPVVIAINMMDIVRKNGDKINIDELSQALGCKVVEISALKGDGVMAAAEAAIDAAKNGKTVPMHTFSGPVEHAIAHIEEATVHGMPEEQQRWYAIKIFERDDKVMQKLGLTKETMSHIEADIEAAEKELDDDAESIITNERYIYIGEVIKRCYKKHSAGKLTTSDKIDQDRDQPLAGPAHLRSCHVPCLLHRHGRRGRCRYRLGKRRSVRRRLAPVRHRLRRYTKAKTLMHMTRGVPESSDGYERASAGRKRHRSRPRDFPYEVEDEETLEVTEDDRFSG